MFSFSSVDRPSQYSLSACRWQPIFSVFYSSQFNGYFLLPQHMYGYNMFGTQVIDQPHNIYEYLVSKHFSFQTERGVCLPTICLWVLFIYVEASIRLKDLKHFPAHLDLCRPFAAHCIGYPVVTWGFDIKGYISYRIRQVRLDFLARWYWWNSLTLNCISDSSVSNGKLLRKTSFTMNFWYSLYRQNSKKRTI